MQSLFEKEDISIIDTPNFNAVDLSLKKISSVQVDRAAEQEAPEPESESDEEAQPESEEEASDGRRMSIFTEAIVNEKDLDPEIVLDGKAAHPVD